MADIIHLFENRARLRKQIISLKYDGSLFTSAHYGIRTVHMLNRSVDLLLCFIWNILGFAHSVQCILRSGPFHIRGRAFKLSALHVKLHQDGLARL